MPMATRRQAQARSRRINEPTAPAPRHRLPSRDADEETIPDHEMLEDEGNGEEEDEEEIEEGDEPFPPPGLKEISSLASWTVSTAKPGNGVAALRSPDTSLFWQSDGPQPHLISIYFFKLVSIVHMRIFLDFESDESYTPTKIQFLAGMGEQDVQEFAEMQFERPTGWMDVDFSNVGPIEPDEAEDGDAEKDIDWSKRPVLRAFLVQIRILENHQNGKDTHLRAVQLFARDEAQQPRRAKGPTDSQSMPMHPVKDRKAHQSETNNIQLAEWMLDPNLR